MQQEKTVCNNTKKYATVSPGSPECINITCVGNSYSNNNFFLTTQTKKALVHAALARWHCKTSHPTGWSTFGSILTYWYYNEQTSSANTSPPSLDELAQVRPMHCAVASLDHVPTHAVRKGCYVSSLMTFLRRRGETELWSYHVLAFRGEDNMDTPDFT